MLYIPLLVLCQIEYKAIDSTIDHPYGINNVVDIAFNIRSALSNIVGLCG
jgi:hypothetical protein